MRTPVLVLSALGAVMTVYHADGWRRTPPNRSRLELMARVEALLRRGADWRETICG